jgi:hypothetical protein
MRGPGCPFSAPPGAEPRVEQGRHHARGALPLAYRSLRRKPPLWCWRHRNRGGLGGQFSRAATSGLSAKPCDRVPKRRAYGNWFGMTDSRSEVQGPDPLPASRRQAYPVSVAAEGFHDVEGNRARLVVTAPMLSGGIAGSGRRGHQSSARHDGDPSNSIKRPPDFPFQSPITSRGLRTVLTTAPAEPSEAATQGPVRSCGPRSALLHARHLDGGKPRAGSTSSVRSGRPCCVRAYELRGCDVVGID